MMIINRFKTNFALLLIALLVSCAAPQKRWVVDADVIPIVQTQDYLSRTAFTHKPNGQPLAAAGVMVYALIDHQPYLLLARETKDGTYTTLSGKLDIGETFAQGALRECWEESAALYALTRKDLTGPIYYEQGPNGHEGVFAVLKTDIIYTTPDLKRAQKRLKADKFLEKDDFVWVPFAAFFNYTQGSDVLALPDGRTLKLRAMFKETLEQPAFYELLKRVQQASH